MIGSFYLALKVSMETAWETEKAALSFLSVMPSDITAHWFIHVIQSRYIISDKPGQREARVLFGHTLNFLPSSIWNLKLKSW